ncbi:hypothetical protein PIB30_042555 [Stylosanthes scabra]|uniref:Uncharacterized protein n=1 Tax=Stylosanthes scabra TaxID=79078 RepID=A0ABU6YE45_9FABA|nr:hypothetical protein [Stylosanthes scabra]
MPTSLGISETRNWRIGGEDERLDMRTAMDSAWMLDGAMEDRACALSLASRETHISAAVNRFRWYPSRFTEPFWNGFEDFMTFESILLWGESIRNCTEAKTPQLKSIRECLELTQILWPEINLLNSRSSRFKDVSNRFVFGQRLKDYKTCLLNRFDKASSRLHVQNFMNRLRSSRFDGSLNRFVFTLFSNLTFKMPSESILPLLNRF